MKEAWDLIGNLLPLTIFSIIAGLRDLPSLGITYEEMVSAVNGTGATGGELRFRVF